MTPEQEELARRFVALFEGNGSAYGTEQGGCVRATVTWETIEGHLFGDTPIGVYPMQQTPEGPKVKWGCVDYDEGDEVSFVKARLVMEALAAIGIPSYVERSRSKGWHVWVFAAGPVPAADMRRCLLAACHVADAPSKEINPKAETMPEGFIGNYVRLPYPNITTSTHVVESLAGRRCIWKPPVVKGDIWRPVELEEFLDQAQTASPTQIAYAASLWKGPPPSAPLELRDDAEEPTELIRSIPGLAFTIWRDGPLDGSDRSGTLMRLARAMRDGGFSPQDCKSVVASADRRWGKYLNRTVPAWHEIDKIVERIYA